MKVMDIKPQPTTKLAEFEKWMNATTADFTNIVGKKIEVKEELEEVEEDELDAVTVEWSMIESADDGGPSIIFQVWNSWEQYYDEHCFYPSNTIGQLLDFGEDLENYNNLEEDDI